MGKSIQDQLLQLTPAQRTLFHGLKQRFAEQLGLTDADLLLIVRRTFIPTHYPAGRSILRPGDYLDHFLMLAAGIVKTTCTDGKGTTICVQMINDGHAFGLPSLARPDEPRQFGAVAHSESLIGLMTPDALRAIIGRLDTPRRLRLLMYGWSANIGVLREKRLLRSLSARERVWLMLWKLAAKSSAHGAERGRVNVRLTQKDIGEIVGTTRSTVNRRLKALGKQVLSKRRGRYVVHEQPPFAAPADFATAAPVGGSPLNDDFERKEMFARLEHHLRAIGLPPDAIKAFVRHARFIIFPPGTQVALPNHEEALSLLISGAALVECPGPQGERLPLLFAKAGWLILGGVPRAVGVGFRSVAHVESCAAVLTIEGLAHVVDAMTAADFVRFLSFGWRVLSHHTWRACIALITKERERIFQLFYQLAHDFPAAHDDGTIIDLPLSVSDIAGLVAANETGVRRHLAQLERAGRVRMVEGRGKRFLLIGLFRNPRAA